MKLLELLIAFILATGLIAFLFHFLLQVESHDTKETDYALYARLSQILPEIHDVHLESDALVFTFDNGIDDDPQYSSLVDAKLYLDQNNLTLSIQPERTEILAQNIRTLRFSFFERPTEEELPAIIHVQVNDVTRAYPLIASGKPIQYTF